MAIVCFELSALDGDGAIFLWHFHAQVSDIGDHAKLIQYRSSYNRIVSGQYFGNNEFDHHSPSSCDVPL